MQTGAFNKPSKLTTSEALTLQAKKSQAKVSAAVAGYRADLTSTAAIKYTKTARALAVKKGYSKKVAKSHRRHKM